MPTTTISPYMLLVLPIPGVEVGPAWASELITALGSLIDAHDHSLNKGVKITPAGLNINADLDIQGTAANPNNLKSIRAARLANNGGTLVAAADWGAIYRVANELYFTDGAGNAVQITLNGALNVAAGNITGMAGGAAVTYNNATKTYVFTQSANKAAAIQCGDVLVTDESAAPGHAIKLHAPAALAADFTWTLPGALPAVQTQLTVDAAGNVASAASALLTKKATLAATPTPPTAGDIALYIDSVSAMLAMKDSAGNSFPVRMIVANTAGIAAFNTVETIIAGGKTTAPGVPLVDFKIPAKTFKAGSTLRFSVEGTCDSSVANNVTVRVRIGANGTTADAEIQKFTAFAATASAGATNFKLVVEIPVALVAGTTMQSGSGGGFMLLNDSATKGIFAGTVKLSPGVAASATFDSSVDNYAELTIVAAANTTSFTIGGAAAEIF